MRVDWGVRLPAGGGRPAGAADRQGGAAAGPGHPRAGRLLPVPGRRRGRLHAPAARLLPRGEVRSFPPLAPVEKYVKPPRTQSGEKRIWCHLGRGSRFFGTVD